MGHAWSAAASETGWHLKQGNFVVDVSSSSEMYSKEIGTGFQEKWR